nr:kinesin-like protein KIF15 [Biomphalaria glabrata]
MNTLNFFSLPFVSFTPASCYESDPLLHTVLTYTLSLLFTQPFTLKINWSFLTQAHTLHYQPLKTHSLTKVQLKELKITKENSKRIHEEEEESANNLVKSLQSKLKEKEHELKQDQKRNKELDDKVKNLLQEKVLKLSFKKYLIIITQRELSSKIKSLQEEKK